MASKLKRKFLRAIKRRIQDPRFLAGVGIALLCMGIIGYAIYMDTRRRTVDPASYRPLLELIAKVESKGNYNAHFGSPNNTTTNFTAMTIAEVQQWQAEFVAQGNASSAVGRYQIIDSTLAGLVKQLGIDSSQKFDQATQDRLAVALLERRGSEKYINQELTREEFAANLAMEWAALPRVLGQNPDSSYYDGDGLNMSLVDSTEVLKAIGLMRAQ